ncbi:MAG: hypothetical protein IJR95_05155 [Lachnospiraceae bacterium]|nr:hypothetical protein [Lachnospiraceae bacterium]
MDKKDLLNAIGEVDQELVEAAAPKGLRNRLRPRRIAAGTIAAACLLLAIFAVSGGWFKRETRPKETKLPSEVGTDYEETKKITGTSASTAPAPLPEITPAPASSEITQAHASSESTPASTETQAQEILYQKDGITVKEGSGGSSGSHTDFSLAYLTEQELFTQPLVMRAVLTDYKPLVITITQEYSIFSDNKIYAALMSFEPISVIHGELPPGQGTVKVFADTYANSSLEDLNFSLRTAGKGREGIIMLHPMEGESHPEYMTQLADYVPGDNQRFAIWEMPGGGLAYEKSAFPGLEKSWTLDQAEAYARQLIEDEEEAPEDFALQMRFQYYGHVPEDNRFFSFDSSSGAYSEEGSTYLEEEYGAENLKTIIRPEREILNQMYRRLKRMKDMPEQLSSGGSVGYPDSQYIEIIWTAEGVTRRISYSGSAFSSHENLERLYQLETELRHYLNRCQDMRQWQGELYTIGNSRRRARSEEIKAALEAAFAEKYGPGGKPEYFQLAEISEGGYLTLWLEPWSEEYQKEIQALLPEEYRKGFLFSEGRGRSEQGSSLYDFRMGLVLGRIMQEREPRWQIIQEETFLKEPLENRLRIGYRYEDGRQSAWYSILLKGQEEEWEPFARLRMQLRVPGSEEGLLSEPITRRDDLEYAYYLSVCRDFRPIREEDRQEAGEPLAWIYYENQDPDGGTAEGILLLLEDGRLMHSSGAYPEKPLPTDDSVDTVTAYYSALPEADMLHLLAIGLWYTEERAEVPQPEAASSEPGLRWR